MMQLYTGIDESEILRENRKKIYYYNLKVKFCF